MNKLLDYHSRVINNKGYMLGYDRDVANEPSVTYTGIYFDNANDYGAVSWLGSMIRTSQLSFRKRMLCWR